jgi:hypothetical protein
MGYQKEIHGSFGSMVPKKKILKDFFHINTCTMIYPIVASPYPQGP